MLRPLLLALALPLALLVPGVAAEASVAREVRHGEGFDDARQDVRKGDLFDEDPEIVAAPFADIVSGIVDHRRHSVLVRTRLAALDRRGHRTLTFLIRTGATTFRGTYTYSRTSPDRRFTLVDQDQLVAEEVRCPGRSTSFDRETDVVRVVVPRSCLGRPSFVRLAQTLTASAPDGDPMWFDDARTRGDGRLTERLGPQLYRDDD